jgi:hypothetical protein
MIDNQSGRRNLTDGWKFELAQTKKALLTEKGKEKYQETVGRPTIEKSLSKTDNDLPKHNTRNEIAEELNWSTGKIFDMWSACHAQEEIAEAVGMSRVSVPEFLSEKENFPVSTKFLFQDDFQPPIYNGKF